MVPELHLMIALKAGENNFDRKQSCFLYQYKVSPSLHTSKTYRVDKRRVYRECEGGTA